MDEKLGTSPETKIQLKYDVYMNYIIYLLCNEEDLSNIINDNKISNVDRLLLCSLIIIVGNYHMYTFDHRYKTYISHEHEAKIFSLLPVSYGLISANINSLFMLLIYISKHSEIMDHIKNNELLITFQYYNIRGVKDKQTSLTLNINQDLLIKSKYLCILHQI
jgi:hypothetical protein